MRPRESFHLVQDRLAALLGCEPARRSAIVASMLHRGPSEVTGYWLQLLIAAGIATLGLVLGSTAVIIGAMLVAPLMGPIVGLGMGLASGSPVLVLRAGLRVLISVTLVTALAAVLTRLLPYHEVNAEIAARTTPTALDLGVAFFCAMAGVFATLRPASDVATTAAGTSIGISLVPPLCVCGYGLGTAGYSLATGAALLFLTNLSAIVLVASLFFAAAGFAQVAVQELEQRELADEQPGVLTWVATQRTSGALRWAFGPWLRLLMPVALIGALYAPLRRGLDRVAWQIETRSDVQAAMSALPGRVVQARVKVESQDIEIVLFLLGSQSEALRARDKLISDVHASTGVTPRVEVFAVPDSTEFEALEKATQRPAPLLAPAAPPPEPPPPTAAEKLEDARALVMDTVELRWPTKAAGPLLDAAVRFGDDGLELRLTHLGAPLDAAALQVLSDVLHEDLGTAVTLRSVALPAEPISLATVDTALLLRVATLLAEGARLPSITACVADARDPKARPTNGPARDLLRAMFDAHPRTARVAAPAAALHFSTSACESPSAPPIPGAP